MIQEERYKEMKFCETAARRPSTNWYRIDVLKFFSTRIPRFAPSRISYAAGPSSIHAAFALPENVFPFAEASEASAPPPASLGIAFASETSRSELRGSSAVPPTASSRTYERSSGCLHASGRRDVRDQRR